MEKSILAMMVMVLGVLAATSLRADDVKVQTVKAYLSATGAKAQYRQMMQLMSNNMKQGFVQAVNSSLSKKDIPKDKKDQINRVAEQHISGFLDAFSTHLDKIMSWDDLVENVYAPILSAQFSVDEMNQVIAFYQSEVGKKMVAKNPTIMRQAVQKVQQNYSARINEFAIKEMQGRMGELKAEIARICDGQC